MKRLVLASSSVYRRALLTRLGLAFETVAPNIDETPLPHEDPEATALRLAREKACAVAKTIPDALIIGSDLVAVCGGRILGKPGHHAAALKQLQYVRGRMVEFHTALCLYDGAKNTMQQANIPTRVQFRHLSDTGLERYLHLEKPYDTAASMKVEGLGITLVQSVQSNDPTALIGLPLIALTDMLDRVLLSGLSKTGHTHEKTDTDAAS